MHLSRLRLPIPKRRPRIPFFRIFYSTTFTTLSLLLAAALLITPSDQIYQSIRAEEIFHIFTIAGFYVLTGIIALLIYGGRLYKTRSALAVIPREWCGTEKGLGMKLGKVGKVIQEGLETSAWIAYTARPRDMSDENAEREASKTAEAGKATPGQQQQQRSQRQSVQPVWGPISHPGWSSPSSSDLPNLHYEPVILELPHLIEAKAVSLAPPSSYQPSTPPHTSDPDPLALSLLQRPSSMSLRAYLSHLTQLSMLSDPTLTSNFLSIYDYARFSGSELNEIEFRGLMSVFADLLRTMTPLDPSLVSTLHAETGAEYAGGEGGGEAVFASPTAPQDIADAQSTNTNSTVQHNPDPTEEWVSARPDVWTSSSSSSSSSVPSSTKSTPSSFAAAANTRGLHTPSIPTLRSRPSAATIASVRSALSAAGSVIRVPGRGGVLNLPVEFLEGEVQRGNGM